MNRAAQRPQIFHHTIERISGLMHIPEHVGSYLILPCVEESRTRQESLQVKCDDDDKGYRSAIRARRAIDGLPNLLTPSTKFLRLALVSDQPRSAALGRCGDRKQNSEDRNRTNQVSLVLCRSEDRDHSLEWTGQSTLQTAPPRAQ